MTENVFEKHNLSVEYIQANKDRLLEVMKVFDALKAKYPDLFLDYTINQYRDCCLDKYYISVRCEYCSELAYLSEKSITYFLDDKDLDLSLKEIEWELKRWSEASEKEKEDMREWRRKCYAFRMECGND